MAKYLYIFLFTLLAMGATAQKVSNGVEFVENKGQWDARVTFMGEVGNGAFFLRKNGFTILQHNPADLARLGSHSGHSDAGPQAGSSGGGKTNRLANAPSADSSITIRSHAYTMELQGANEQVQISGDKIQPGINNYFLGNDPKKWAGECRVYSAVIYKDIYPNIDMRYYTEEGWVKYEFIVHPGGDPSRIVMNYKGADKLSLKKGALQVTTSVGTIQELAPYTFQSTGKGRVEVDNRYQLKGNTLRFSVGAYDRSQVLVIDPTLIFSTFTKSVSDNWGYTATYGPDGTLYSGGIVFGSGFPVSDGAFQTQYKGSGSSSPYNMGIMKFNALGTNRVYATYIGGKEADQPHSLIVNNRGNLVIAGRTASDDYPFLKSYLGGTGRGNWDIVLTELNANGSALIGSILVGGSGTDGQNVANSHTGGANSLINFYGDDARSEVFLDGAGNIYLASCTQSTDFYTTSNAPFKTLAGKQDAVLIKTTPDLSNVLMCTYFGGSQNDAGYVVGISPLTGDIYIGGATESDDFPGDHSGTVGDKHQGASDGFIAVFSNDGTILRKSTFIGTDKKDAVLGFEFDRFGDPYTMGVTYGSMPRINAAYGVDNSKQFVGKLARDLSAWQYRTTFGSPGIYPNISPVAFLVDRCQNVYVSGWGGTNLGGFEISGTRGMPVTSDALKSTTDGNDFYFIVIKRDATELMYATYFGQDGNLSEHVDGGTSRYDQNGVIYQAICANCFTGEGQRPQFPVTPGAWCCSNKYSGAYIPGNSPGNGAQCNLAAVKIHFNFAGVGSGVASYINGVRDTMGCVPLTIQLSDTIRNARSYIWSFGDGSPDVRTSDPQLEHTYNNTGVFRVRLIAIDSATCNISDTSYINIKVSAAEAQLGFDGSKQPPCESLTFKFTNLSSPPAGYNFNDSSFLWDFGDGTELITGLRDVIHSYPSAGSYQVRMVLRDTIFCNVDDAITKEYYLSPLVKADFEIPNGCVPYTAQINNKSIAGATWLWDFGDGTTSAERDPVKVYPNAGTYTVTLTVTDPNTCNVTDRTTRTVLVQNKPTAGFSFAPVVPVENTPHIFTNTSSPDAINFIWEFGDGEEYNTNNRLPVEHQYNTSGRFDVCLQAINASGCIDTLCQPVEAIVVPRIDLPNAFTPLGSPPNNIFTVKGFGIARMRFMIFNRFGQKVFETATVKGGWDGKYNGVVQPMDVYAYVLDVEFTDGTRTTRKGDITLIR